jgi:chromosomal replication initiator protein DnaA
LAEAAAIQSEKGGFIGQILVKLGYVKQEAVASCLVKQCKIPHLSLLDYDISPDILGLIPQEVCRKFQLLPIDKLGRILTVAMVDPLDLDALEMVRAACPDLRIKPILCNWEHFEMVAGKVFKGRQDHPASGRTITAQSLGLSMDPSAHQAAPAARPTTPPEAVPETVSALVQELEAGAPPSDLATIVFEAQSALAQTVRETMTQAAQSLAEAKAASTGATAAELTQVIRDSVSSAMQETMGALTAQWREAAPARADSVPAAAELGQLSETIRDSVSGAMEEALATVVVQLRANAPRRGEEGGAEAPGVLAEAVQTLRQALEANQQAQATQGAQLAQIAEAARQSVEQATHLVESAVVGEGSRVNLLRHTPGRHASVAAFRTTGEAGANPEAFAQADREVLDALESEHPVETLTLDSFFPGSANAFTFKLSRAVASSPGGEYNPFFLFGAVGLGKTHLISAIGNAILANHPKSRVGYVSASHFSRRLTEAMRESALDAFRENYCHWDVLILDDIQFLGGRVEAQEEFFHIFNVLHQQRRQIIIASDKAPDRLGLLEQRLVSRFASGIVAELKAPEWETRMQILRHHAARAKVPVAEEILSLIAMRVPNDIRKMTGSLRKIVAFAQLVGQDLSCEMADEILSHLGAVAAA